ncbi:WD40 repeat-like protein [Paxillus ammoniavirescens]|nr:WD40 repeat-like protein [Paxillus ammoniavirescens]
MSNTSQKPTHTAAKPVTTMSGHERYINGVTYLPGGERVVSCSDDKTVRIWDVEKGKQEGTSMVHKEIVHALAVTKDGKRILSGGEDKRITILMWDVETHERIEAWTRHTGNIRCIALSPDDPDGWVHSLRFSPNGEKLACAYFNRGQVYDVDSGRLVLGPIKVHETWFRCVLWSLSGSQLFSASDDLTIRCWNSETGKPISKPWRGHTNYVASLSLSPDGTKLASASGDQTIRFWDTHSGEPIGYPLKHENYIYAVAFSPCGEFVASAGGREASIWRVPWWDESQKQLPAGRRLIDSSSPPPAQVTHSTPIPIAMPEQRYPDTARNLNHIRSNFAHDLTGYVMREGEEPITSGSFGDIYRDKLRLDGKSIDVAVKAIRTYSADDGDDAQKNKKIRRELKTWANLDHVNILPLFGTTTNFGRFPAMVCPWLENGSLTSYLERRHDALNPVERVSLISDAAAGLQYLHSQSIVHGDLSGASSQAGGTLRWTAPELLDLQVPDDVENLVPRPLSDVYSFGRIILQVLTGKVPYHYYVSEGKVLSAILQGIIPMRPNPPVVTDSQWRFMQRCWMPVDAIESRPRADELVAFARQELVAIEKATL